MNMIGVIVETTAAAPHMEFPVSARNRRLRAFVSAFRRILHRCGQGRKDVPAGRLSPASVCVSDPNRSPWLSLCAWWLYTSHTSVLRTAVLSWSATSLLRG